MPTSNGVQPVTGQSGESFAETWARVEASTPDDESASEPSGEAEAAPAASAPAETAKPAEKAAKGKKSVTPGGDAMEQLQKLAKDLNLEVVGGKVLPSERNEFREWKRKQTEGLKVQEQQRLSKIEEREKGLDEKLKKSDAVLKAQADGDYEALAKALGHESWDKLQEDYIARVSDPHYKRMRELEAWKAEQTEREEKQKAELEQRQKQQQHLQGIAEYKKKLAGGMAQSKDPVLQAMGDDPEFVNIIFQVLKENFDPDDTEGGTLTPEQALDRAPRGAQRTVRQTLTLLRDRLNKGFGGVPAAAAPATPKGDKRPGPKSAPVPPGRTSDASPEKKNMSFAERAAYERRRLNEAAEADRRAELEGKDL